MTPWPARDPFDLLVIGKRSGVLLLAVAAYYVAAGLVVQSFQLQVIHRGSAGSLMNTLILSLLMSFRNQAAYARWWEARGLWGQLTNDMPQPRRQVRRVRAGRRAGPLALSPRSW